MTRFITSLKRHALIWKLGVSAGVALFWLAVWQIAYLLVAQEILLVSPVQAAIRLFSLAREAVFWQSVAHTCLRVVCGFLVALLAGCILAITGACFLPIRKLVAPLMGIIRATPVASFIILALVWMTTNSIPTFIAFLVVAPIVWGNLMAGIDSVDQNLLEMAKVFRLSRGKVLCYIYLPAEAPHFVSACTGGLGLAWKSAVAAEVISLPHMAIGRQIYNSKIYLETADLFAWTMMVILLSLVIEKCAVWLLRKLTARLSGQFHLGEGKTHAADS